jgi:hypothetical protein
MLRLRIVATFGGNLQEIVSEGDDPMLTTSYSRIHFTAPANEGQEEGPFTCNLVLTSPPPLFGHVPVYQEQPSTAHAPPVDEAQ